ncbi:MAG: hypothetical protein CL840_19465 [Crocinitomicaceae bacterium]|nr:hypothetical protein [Crocinitomicaceae bacterium]|tara:strand:+ start:7577 stop:15844 length:8268 start_codon:yes stop_codon:yes gene_type:complete
MKKLLLLVCIIFSLSSFAQLSGTYTIGGTSPNYSTIDSAVTDLEIKGVSGHVTFKIRQGTYKQQVSLDSIPGSDTNKTVTFLPDSNKKSGVILEYTGSSTTTNYVFRVNGVKYVTFKHLHFIKKGSNFGRCLLFEGANSNILLDSNEFTGIKKDYGLNSMIIYDAGGSTNQSHNVVISHNTFNFGAGAVMVVGESTSKKQNGWEIRGNKVQNYEGISFVFTKCHKIIISNNEVATLSNSLNGNGISGEYSSEIKIYDNHIVVSTKNSSTNGIILRSCSGVSANRSDIYNNMIAFPDTAKSKAIYGIRLILCNYTSVMFNSLSATSGAGYLFHSTTVPTSVYFWNNIAAHYGTGYAMYFGSNGYFYSYNCLHATTNRICNRSYNSTNIVANPKFTSSTDLHTNATAVNGKAYYVKRIKYDIDGEVRDTAKPDIGADEFSSSPSNDAGITGITNSIACTGSNDVFVKLKNYGGDTLTAVRLNWSVAVNGGTPVVQSFGTFSGSLLSGKDTTLKIGSYVASKNDTLTILAWTSGPNNKADTDSTNDSTSKIIRVAMSGIYTIGGASPDYTSLTTALAELKSKGVCGHVTFNLRPGTYQYYFLIDNAPGVSPTSTFTLQSDPAYSGRAILNVPNNLALNWIHDVVIQNLEIRGKIQFHGDCYRVKIRNNKIVGKLSNSKNLIDGTIQNTTYFATRLTDIAIDSNHIMRGSGAVYFQGKYNNSISRIKVTNNQIDSMGHYGIALKTLDSSLIESNTIIDTNWSGSSAIYLNLATAKISRNKLILNSDSSFDAIFCYGNSSRDTILLENNFIHLDSAANGIHLFGSEYSRLTYNTVIMHSVIGKALLSYQNKHLYLRNNNFAKFNAGYLIEFNVSIGVDSDHNNFYYGKAPFMRNVIDLNRWRTSKNDSNSHHVNPYFYQPYSPRPAHALLNGNAIPIPGVKYDLYRVKRDSLNPDIGAVEFATMYNDAAAKSVDTSSICPGISSVRFSFSNVGSNKIYSAKIKWAVSVNSGTPVFQTPFHFQDSLTSYTDTTVILGNYNFLSNNSYQIIAMIDSVNGVKDSSSINDSARTKVLKPKLSGTYTVGGTSPDFANLDTALKTLIKVGICGPVILNLRQGAYKAYHKLAYVRGTNSVNTITIQTEPSYSGQAEISNAGIAVKLTGENYILKNLKIKTTKGGHVIDITGSPKNNTIRGNTIQGYDTNSTWSYFSVIKLDLVTLVDSNYLTIDSNIVLNGSYGFEFSIRGAANDHFIVIKDNVFKDFYSRGVHCTGATNLKIIRNNFYVKKVSKSVRVIFLSAITHPIISRNKIYYDHGTAIHCNGNMGSVLYPPLISNNFIIQKDRNATLSTGIYLGGGRHELVLNNTVSIVQDAGYSICFYGNRGFLNTEIKNNIFYSRSGLVYYLDRWGSTVNSFDHNNLYTGGSNAVSFNSVLYKDVGSWKKFAKVLDQNSLDVNPFFTNDTIPRPNNSALNGKADTTRWVVIDIDGEPRDTLNPDIGADEFLLKKNDVGISDLSKSICASSGVVKVKLVNHGSIKATGIKVNWGFSVNGGAYAYQTPYWFNDTLGPGADTLLAIGTYAFSVKDSYAGIAFTDSVNGVLDSNNLNDTVRVDTLMQNMSGIYNVDSAGGAHWKTIDSAVSALLQYGVCGPVVIYVKSGTYNERSVIKRIKGSSKINTITFLGDTSTRRPKWTNGIAPITFAATQFVTVKNFNLVTTGRSTILFEGSSSNIIIDSNRIVGKPTFSSSLFESTILSNPASYRRSDTNIHIINNEILYGANGIYLPQNLSTGSNHRIENNKITSFQHVGIYAANMDSLLVSGNVISTDLSVVGPFGIKMTGSLRGTVIKKNDVQFSKGGTGIQVEKSLSTGNNTIIENNFISIRHTSGSVGIAVQGDSLHVVHNSIHLYGKSIVGVGFRQYGYGTSTTLFKNNIVSNTGGGLAIDVNVLSDYYGDYNNYYTPNSSRFGRQGTAYKTSFASWKSSSQKDSNSISVNPFFTDSVNLHVYSKVIKAKGTPLGLRYDIDNDLRNLSAPDMGADEFTAYAVEGGLLRKDINVCRGKYPVYATLINHGDSSITGARVAWQLSVNGGAYVQQTTVSWTGNLSSAKDTLLFLDSIGVSKSASYKIRAYLIDVNGKLDNNAVNDTSIFNVRIDSSKSAKVNLPSALCYNTLPFSVNATPIGGVLIGNGITSGVLNPRSVGVGSDSLMYIAIDTNSCRDSVVVHYSVDSVPKVGLSIPDSMCLNGGRLTLNGGSPSGGLYYGKNVTSNSYLPFTSGLDTIHYSYTDGNGCSDSTMETIRVDPIPTVSLTVPDSVCLNISSILLQTGRPVGGVYSGNGVILGTYKPINTGVDTIRYTATNKFNCSATAFKLITVNPVTKASFFAIGNLCLNASPLLLNYGSPLGGVYAGKGVNGNNYKPIQIGTDTLQYIYTNGFSCSDTAYQTVTVDSIPVVSILSWADQCLNSPPFALFGGHPAGGSYFGSGISGNQYDPSTATVGLNTIAYHFLDARGCSDTAETKFVIHALPTVSMDSAVYACELDSTLLLSSGRPLNGQYSGSFINGNTFDPRLAGLGRHEVYYEFTDANTCTNVDTGKVVVEANPVFNLGNDKAFCGSNVLELNPGINNMTYLWNTGDTSKTIKLNQGGAYSIVVTDTSTHKNCSQSDTINVSYKAICVGIDENLLSRASIQYYPNPNNGRFFLKLDSEEEGEVKLIIRNMQGQIVSTQSWEKTSKELLQEIDLSDQSSGVYYLNLSTEKGRAVHRITLNR